VEAHHPKLASASKMHTTTIGHVRMWDWGKSSSKSSNPAVAVGFGRVGGRRPPEEGMGEICRLWVVFPLAVRTAGVSSDFDAPINGRCASFSMAIVSFSCGKPSSLAHSTPSPPFQRSPYFAAPSPPATIQV
jgi:hypothetical protein